MILFGSKSVTWASSYGIWLLLVLLVQAQMGLHAPVELMPPSRDFWAADKGHVGFKETRGTQSIPCSGSVLMFSCGFDLQP